MRFIVDIYRYLVFVMIALAIIAIVFFTLQFASPGNSLLGASFFLTAGGVLVALIASMGLIATFISIHDRHAELVDELRALREELAGRQ